MKLLLLILTISIQSFVFAGQEQNSSSSNFGQEKAITSLKAYPNPLVNKTQISFYTSHDQDIIFTIKNLLGKTVYLDELRTVKGENTLTFYKDKLESGMYIYSIQTETEILSRRLVIR